MIADIDDALRTLVRREAVNGTDVELLFDAPTRDWAARRNVPALDFYLYDIREDLERRTYGVMDVKAARRSDRGSPPAPEDLQALLPRDGVDPAARGRAPAAVGGAVLPLAPPRPARGCADRRGGRHGLPGRRHRRPPASRRAFHLRRVVRARRRAQAVARRGLPGRRRSDRSARRRAAGARATAIPVRDRRHGRSPSAPARSGQPSSARRLRSPRNASRVAPIPPEDASSPSARPPVTAIAEAAAPAGLDPSLAHLLGRLDVVVSRARHTVRGAPSPRSRRDERFRGLYISDAEVDAHLSAQGGAVLEAVDSDSAALARRVEAEADRAEAAGADLRLRRLAAAFGLDELDIDLLLVALAPDIDPRLERVYAYLHDDVSRRRASTGLALQLCGAERTSAARFAFAAGAPLVSGGLLVIDDADRPFLTRSLRVPDRVTAHLLGRRSARAVGRRTGHAVRGRTVGDVAELVAALAGALPARLRARAARRERGCRWPGEPSPSWGSAVLSIDLARVGRDDDVRGVVQRLAREALLSGRSLLAGPGGGAGRPGARGRAPAGRDARSGGARRVAGVGPAVVPGGAVHGRSRSAGSRRTLPHLVERAWTAPSSTARRWTSAPSSGSPPSRSAGPPPSPRPRRPRPDEPCGSTTCGPGHGRRTRAGLERLARRVSPRVGWEDLVLAGPVVTQLRDLGAACATTRTGARRVGHGASVVEGAGRQGPVRRRVGHRQDDRRGGHRRRPRSRHVRRRPLDGRRQVRRRDREEPRSHLRGGRSGQRGPAVRRGRRALRATLGGQGRPGPLRQRRSRLPAAAHGVVRRARHPHHQSPGQPRRGVRPPPGRDRGLPDARGGGPPAAVGAQPRPRCPAGRRHRPGVPRRASSSCRAGASATSSCRPPSRRPSHGARWAWASSCGERSASTASSAVSSWRPSSARSSPTPGRDSPKSAPPPASRGGVGPGGLSSPARGVKLNAVDP